MLTQTELPDRFWDKVSVNDRTGCWEWVGARTAAGYAEFSWGGKPAYGHRLAYESRVGPVGEALQLDHLCRNRRCVNPSHLEPVTQQENIRRGDHSNKGWQAKKTHCKNGHEFSEANTHHRPTGGRSCRKCKVAAVARYRKKARA